MIGVATIVVEQNCDNCGKHCDYCFFWLVKRQLWSLIATIVNIATIVITSGSMVSPRPQTLPRHASGAWFDLKTMFENLNLVLDIRDDKFHR